MARSILMVLAAALVLVAAQAASGAPVGGKARVMIADTTPFTVAGFGFPARESVIVTVQGKGLRLRKSVASTGAGRFSASWTRPVATGGCAQIAISAVAADGTRAFWKSVPTGQCAQPIEP